MAGQSAVTRLKEAARTKESSDELDTKYGPLSNIDLEPSPPQDRSWSAWYFGFFQFSIAFSPTTYNIGSSLYSIGLSWWTIIIASFVGTLLCCIVLFFNSRGPSRYHVGFPVMVRSSAGVYGAYFFVFIRMIVAIFYEGTQTYYASRLLDVALRCIFGSSWKNMPNHLPASAGITTAQMAAFFITWLLQLPSAWMHPSKAGPVFAVKSFLSPIAYLVTMIWAIRTFNGVELNLSAKYVSGSDLGWSFMRAINTVVSGVVPPMVNIADLARYGKRPRDMSPLVFGLFISKPLVILIGLFTTAAGAKGFGKAFWNLWDFYSAVLDAYWGPGTRTLVFLGAFIQAFATVVTNISSNAIPIGCDLAALFPSYFTIVRGQILCNLLIWAVVPWLLVNSAQNFLTFLGSYLCFITPVVACMMVDYWLVRNGNLHIPSLYRADKASPYFYTGGVNLRAAGAWVSGVVLVISGISGAIRPGSISQTAVNVYNTGFLLSIVTSAVVYYILSRLFPPKLYPDGHEDTSTAWEYMATTEGFLPDDPVIPGYIRERMLLGEEPVRVDDGPSSEEKPKPM
ncbi:putative allantoin permease [Thozetella sp. PMI_491]|nr:putative allantoin permease [Thozetella sp. PMI_491]